MRRFISLALSAVLVLGSIQSVYAEGVPTAADELQEAAVSEVEEKSQEAAISEVEEKPQEAAVSEVEEVPQGAIASDSEEQMCEEHVSGAWEESQTDESMKQVDASWMQETFPAYQSVDYKTNYKEALTLEAEVNTSEDGLITYQWYYLDEQDQVEKEVEIEGAVYSTYTVPAEDLIHPYMEYHCKVKKNGDNFKRIQYLVDVLALSIKPDESYGKDFLWGKDATVGISVENATEEEPVYEWWFDGDHKLDCNSATCTIPSELFHSVCAEYQVRCRVTCGEFGREYQWPIRVDYELSGSGNVAIKYGEQAILTANNDETLPVESYTWYETDEEGYERVLIEGEHAASLRVNMKNAGSCSYYICSVSCGGETKDVQFSVYSHGTLKTVYCTEYWTDQIKDRNLQVYAFSTDPNAQITYQWQKVSGDDYYGGDYQSIPGATASVYSIPASELREYNRFRCIVSDGNQEVICDQRLNLNAITYVFRDKNGKKISNYSISSYEDFTFSIDAACDLSEPIAYQWKMYDRNSYQYVELEGETSSGITIPKETIAEMKQNGVTYITYYCDMSCGAFSCNTWIRFYIQDIISGNSGSYLTVKKGEPVTLKCEAVSANGSPLQYQWYKNTTSEEGKIAGANSSEYVVDTDAMEQGSSDYFYCKVTDAFGYSQNCCQYRISISSSLKLESEYNHTVIAGSDVFLSVYGESEEGELSYQWYKGYGDDKTPIIGANESVYVVNSAELEDKRTYYSCEVTDGISTSTKEMQITVITPTDTLICGKAMKVLYQRDMLYFRFVAPKDGKYEFYSSGNYYAEGYLYSKDLEYLAYNDYSGSGSNFRIVRTLKAGEIYYLGMDTYYTNREFTLTADYCKDQNEAETGTVDRDEDSREVVHALYGDKVLLNPEFDAVEGAGYQWYIYHSAYYDSDPYYKINGATEPTYTVDWSDCESSYGVVELKACMYGADHELLETKKYFVYFWGIETSSGWDNTEYITMKRGETRTLTPSISRSLGKDFMFNWYRTSVNYSENREYLGSSESINYTMDSSEPLKIYCNITDGYNVINLNYIILPKDYVEISGVSLSLLENGNIGMNFYITAHGHGDIVYNITGMNGYSTGEPIESGDPSIEKYRITKELSSAEMTEEVTMNLCLGIPSDEEEIPLNVSCTYSVARYADQILGDSSYSEYWPIVRKLINHGTAAQNYFGYNTEKLPADLVSNMTEADKKVADLTAAQLAGYGTKKPQGAEGLCYYGSSLILDSDISIRHYFRLEEGYDIRKYGFFVNGRKLTPSSKAGMYYVDIPAGNYGAMSENTLLDIYTAIGKTTLEYSVRDYIAKAYPTADGSFKALLNTLW